jgi:hypothetical protein
MKNIAEKKRVVYSKMDETRIASFGKKLLSPFTLHPSQSSPSPFTLHHSPPLKISGRLKMSLLR